MEHARHVFRVGLVLAVLIVGFVFGRAFAVPDTYGLHGPYRYAALAEHAAPKPKHGGSISCAECHKENYTKLMGAGHKAVSCEICHGPVSAHAAGGKKIADAAVDRRFTLCIRCHAKITGRPEGFKQIEPQRHVADVGEKLEGAVCLDCHNPHTLD